jgi:hypothetical protein
MFTGATDCTVFVLNLTECVCKIVFHTSLLEDSGATPKPDFFFDPENPLSINLLYKMMQRQAKSKLHATLREKLVPRKENQYIYLKNNILKCCATVIIFYREGSKPSGRRQLLRFSHRCAILRGGTGC